MRVVKSKKAPLRLGERLLFDAVKERPFLKYETGKTVFQQPDYDAKP